jgi:hypothetical protein
MDIIQKLSLIAMLVMIVYAIMMYLEPEPMYINSETKKNEIPTPDQDQETDHILSMYNENATGILPSNHSKFETPADFSSDTTNLSQFYKNNPELFHPDQDIANPASWDQSGQDMFMEKENERNDKGIIGYNFEHSIWDR